MRRQFIFAILLLAATCATVQGEPQVAATPIYDESVEPVVFQSGPPQTYIDLDQLALEATMAGPAPSRATEADVWSWQLLPYGLVYENYLAGTKESRLSISYIKPQDEEGWWIDGTVGARVGVIRYGTFDPIRPEGFQVDVEGSAQLRLDPQEDRDLRSVDFRCGLPFSYGVGPFRWKFGYYHISAHVGDEYMLKNPGFNRLNFSRDVLILGHAFYFTPQTRIYAEAGWAFYSDVTEPWEFQFGIDHAPNAPTGFHGAPFWALNGHLRQEVDFGGSLTAQIGWAWRSDVGSPLMRAGFHYFNGKSNQYSFYNDHEEQLGLALWYDF